MHLVVTYWQPYFDFWWPWSLICLTTILIFPLHLSRVFTLPCKIYNPVTKRQLWWWWEFIRRELCPLNNWTWIQSTRGRVVWCSTDDLVMRWWWRETVNDCRLGYYEALSNQHHKETLSQHCVCWTASTVHSLVGKVNEWNQSDTRLVWELHEIILIIHMSWSLKWLNTIISTSVP